jgi:hypothetical protein
VGCESSIWVSISKLSLIIASRNWSHITFTGWDQSAPYGHTLNLIGSELYVFGGIGKTILEWQFVDCLLDDFISFDWLKHDKPTAGWRQVETAQKPSARSGHICVSLRERGPLLLCIIPPRNILIPDLAEKVKTDVTTIFGSTMRLRTNGLSRELRATRLHQGIDMRRASWRALFTYSAERPSMGHLLMTCMPTI